jgi:Cu2+-exporting ATPase
VDGREVVAGAPSFVRGQVAATPDWAAEAEMAATGRSLTPVLVAVDGAVVAVAACGDAVLDDAAESVARLQRRGWEVSLLSGDHPQVVRRVAEQIGLDPDRSEGGASPERKVEAVRAALARGRPVMMVGDGVNDAAALAAATVGVAVHGGAEASLVAADVFLRRPGVAPVVALVEGSRRAERVIRRNLAVSLLYNVVTAALAMGGAINPLLAAILMPISSLTVVTLSYRSKTF